jgi:starch synthase
VLVLIIAPTKIEDVWLLTFEYDGIASLGGLGRAVAMYAKALSKDGYRVTVFMPSHGRHMSKDVKGFKPIEEFHVCGYRVGVDGNRYRYCIGAEEIYIDGVKIVLFKGLDHDTGRFLDDWHIYAYAEEKACLYTRALIHWIDRFNNVPHLIHANDWSSALAGVALKIFFELRGYAIPFIYSIHLLSWRSFPWHYASSDWCGLPDVLHRIWRFHRHETVNTRSLWDSVYGNIDWFASIESDILVSNSWSYMNEILNRFGRWMEEKTFVIHNVTDWSIEDVETKVESVFKTKSRSEVRKILVNEFLRNLKKRKIGEIHSCRFLVSAAGRVTWNKGFDIILNALDYIDRELCVVVMGIPIGDIEYEKFLSSIVGGKWGRALIILDSVDQETLKTVIYVSNVFVVPSRYEPFGLVSIEAQSLGTPVVVASIGGLPETVLDLRHDPINGSGVVVSINDLWGMGEAINDISILTEFVDTNDVSVLRNLRSFWARDIVYRNPQINLRANAIKWIDSRFREDRLRELLRSCYEKARNYAYYRALSPL